MKNHIMSTSRRWRSVASVVELVLFSFLVPGCGDFASVEATEGDSASVEATDDEQKAETPAVVTVQKAKGGVKK